MSEIQRFKNETNRSNAHWFVYVWSFCCTQIRENFDSSVKTKEIFNFDDQKSSTKNNSMRNRRIFFIFAVLKFSYWVSSLRLFHHLIYVYACSRISIVFCLIIELWTTFESWFLATSIESFHEFECNKNFTHTLIKAYSIDLLHFWNVEFRSLINII